MIDEMKILEDNGIWALGPLPSRKTIVGCR